MHHKHRICLALALAAALHAAAFDFAATTPSGHTLYFVRQGGAARVVPPSTTATPTQRWSGYTKPTGSLVIPATIASGTDTLAVEAIAPFAFANCTGLVEVATEEGLRAVGDDAFFGCTSLQSLALPSTADSLGFALLSGCTALQRLTLLRPTPPVAYRNPLSGASLSAATLVVPCGSEAAYREAEHWASFGTIVTTPCSYRLTLLSNHSARGTATGSGTYAPEATATLVATPAPGHFFACWSDGDTTSPRLLTLSADLTLTAHFFAFRHDTLRLADTSCLGAHLAVVSASPEWGLAIGTTDAPRGTLIEIAALPLEGYAFAGWSDGSTLNPRQVVVGGATDLYIARFAPAPLSATAATAAAWTLHAEGLRLTVGAPEGELIRIVDAQGRRVASQPAASARPTIGLPQPGLYAVSLGSGPARKIIVGR